MCEDSSGVFTIEDALDIRTFADRAPIRLSADGRFVAYTLEDRSEDVVREQFWLTDTDTGAGRHILPEASRAWAAGWSPVEPTAAFVGDTGEGPRLWIYDTRTGDTRQVSPVPLADTPFHFSLPQWTADGKAFVCALASRIGRPGYDRLGHRISGKAMPEEKPAEDGVTVRCWESPPAVRKPDDTEPDRYWSTLARIDLSTGKVTPLVEGIHCDSWSISPDGRNVAYLELIRDVGGANLFRLCVVPAEGGEVRVLDPHVIEDYGVSLSWSPDSTRIAYCPNHDVAVVSLEGGNSRVVMSTGEGIIDDFYEAPLWNPDGSFLLTTRRASVWRIPLDRGEPVDLLPDRGTAGVRGIASPGGGSVIWSAEGESTIVEMRDWRSGEIGLAHISLTGEGILHSELAMQMLSDVPRYHLDVSPTRGLISFVRQSAAKPMDVWLTDASLLSSRRVTNLNPQVDEGQFSSPRLITWTGPDGREHRSAYFRPVGTGEGPHPVVLVVYEGSQSALLSMFGSHPVYNLQVLTNHGYGVCLPDEVHMSYENQAEALRGMLDCAVKSLIGEGIADPKRIGILGHSFGGYIVNAAVTGLDCFAAAVTSAGIANYTSAYGSPSPSGDGSSALFVESCQPHMGVPPWENPERYIENSPLFALDRVTTPLLIVHGDQDWAISQAWEMFNGLRRLSKTASLAIYRGEDHAQCDWRRPNVIDFWRRVLEWFDRYMGPAKSGLHWNRNPHPCR